MRAASCAPTYKSSSSAADPKVVEAATAKLEALVIGAAVGGNGESGMPIAVAGGGAAAAVTAGGGELVGALMTTYGNSLVKPTQAVIKSKDVTLEDIRAINAPEEKLVVPGELVDLIFDLCAETKKVITAGSALPMKPFTEGKLAFPVGGLSKLLADPSIEKCVLCPAFPKPMQGILAVVFPKSEAKTIGEKYGAVGGNADNYMASCVLGRVVHNLITDTPITAELLTKLIEVKSSLYIIGIAA